MPQTQFVLIVAPHTSNWDFVIGLMARYIVNQKIHFLAKAQLFFFPLGTFLRAVGGAAVDRSKASNRVEQVVELFKTNPDFKLAITPEGTRSPVKRWKEGFYHIAMKADVPIVMVAFDYASKEIRIAKPFKPTGDISKDFPVILDYFRGVKGRYPKEIP